MPLPTSDAPVGLSFIGRRGCDRRLLALAQRFCAKMKKS
jgi:amidase